MRIHSLSQIYILNEKETTGISYPNNGKLNPYSGISRGRPIGEGNKLVSLCEWMTEQRTFVKGETLPRTTRDGKLYKAMTIHVLKDTTHRRSTKSTNCNQLSVSIYI